MSDVDLNADHGSLAKGAKLKVSSNSNPAASSACAMEGTSMQRAGESDQGQKGAAEAQKTNPVGDVPITTR